MNNMSYATSELKTVQVSCNTDTAADNYDEFDSFADDMDAMGMKVEELQPTSTFNVWVQKIGTPLVMKYLVLKTYLRDFCFWMVGLKPQPKK